MRNNGGWFVGLAALALLVCLVAGAATCAPGPEKAVQTLHVSGFKDVKITDTHRFAASWYGCSDKDGVAHEATATNPAGQRVSVVVCCGVWLKGCTVRVP